jgi:hypothetical protein
MQRQTTFPDAHVGTMDGMTDFLCIVSKELTKIAYPG